MSENRRRDTNILVSTKLVPGEKGQIYTATLTDEVLHPIKYIGLYETFRQAKEGDLIRFYISSPGGDVLTGISILNCMANCKATIETIALGLCGSIAAMIWSFGDKPSASFGSTIMYHMPSHTDSDRSQTIKERAGNIIEYCDAFLFTLVNKGLLSEAEYKLISVNKSDVFIGHKEMNGRIANVKA